MDVPMNEGLASMPDMDAPIRVLLMMDFCPVRGRMVRALPGRGASLPLQQRCLDPLPV